MNMRRSLLSLVALGVAAPTIAQAHPGLHMHGFAEGLAHPLTGLDHLLAMIAVGFWAASLGGRARWIVPAAFVSVMAGGALAGAVGLPALAIEYLIAASVVALGLLIAFEVRIPTAPAAALVGLFALAHGYAHGAEAPAGQGLLAFAVGFIASTALLHGVGLGLGALSFAGLTRRIAGFAMATAGVFLAAFA